MSKGELHAGSEPAGEAPAIGAARIAGAYVVVAVTYIWLSDSLLLALTVKPEQLARYSSLKGTAFVLITGLSLFGLVLAALRRAHADAARIQRGREALLVADRRATAGMLAASIAHDMNNLLMPLHMGVDELRAGASGQADGLLEGMSDALDRLTGLSRRLSRAGREQAGVFQRLDLAELVRSTTAVSARHPSVRGVEVKVDAPAQLPFATHPGLVDQVLLNLLLNAAEAGAAHIHVHLADAGAQGVRLEVHDDGPGIADEQLVFSPFHTTKPTGTGLGLYSVQACAELHGGAVEVGASPLGGALLRVRLPAVDADAKGLLGGVRPPSGGAAQASP